MSTQLMPRPLALAKLLALGDMHHAELPLVCGWKDDEFRTAVSNARAAGLIRRYFRNHVVWFTVRGAAPKKFAVDGNNTLRR
jgi:hypothetical protein